MIQPNYIRSTRFNKPCILAGQIVLFHGISMTLRVSYADIGMPESFYTYHSLPLPLPCFFALEAGSTL